MAKSPPDPDQPDTPPDEPKPEEPAEPDEARRKFLAGELTWREYTSGSDG